MTQQTYEDTTHSHRVAIPTGKVTLDRVRWGPIVAGMFVALSTLAVLAVLGAAIGLSSADRNSSAETFGIGAGVWGGLSALIAFFVGGAVSALTAATPVDEVSTAGRVTGGNGLLQGAMVWAVAIPLSAYLVASAASGAARVVGNTAATAVQAGAAASGQTIGRSTEGQGPADRIANADNPQQAVDQARKEGAAATQQAKDAASAVGDQLQGAKQSVQQAMSPENLEHAAGLGARGSWGLLASLVLSLAAASLGGYLGGHSRTLTTTVAPTR